MFEVVVVVVGAVVDDFTLVVTGVVEINKPLQTLQLASKENNHIKWVNKYNLSYNPANCIYSP